MQRVNRLAASCGLAALLGALLGALLPLAAFAHEQRAVANGQNTMVVGFLDEPAFTGEKNGLDLTVTKPGGTAATPAASGGDDEAAGAPVPGLDQTLKAEVIFGDQKMALTLEPRFRAPGSYNAYFFPMAAGDYTFHIFGDIAGTKLDEQFTSSPEGFGAVEPRESLEFPKASGSTGGTIGAIGDDSHGAGGAGFGGRPIGALIGAAALWVVLRRGALDLYPRLKRARARFMARA